MINTHRELADKYPSKNIGKKRNSEQRKRISDAHKGLIQSEESKKKRGDALRGKKRSPECIMKLIIGR